MYTNFSMMTWKEWVADHPNTLVLSKRTRRGMEGMAMGYTDYHRSSRIGVTGQLRFNDKQLPAKVRVPGFRIDDQPYAVDLVALARKGSITTMTSGGKAVKIVGTRDGIGGQVFVASDGKQEQVRPRFHTGSRGEHSFPRRKSFDHEDVTQLLSFPRPCNCWTA
jgi:Protein of unknown function (DUF3179)